MVAVTLYLQKRRTESSLASPLGSKMTLKGESEL
jgi:hypothetical protein